MDELKIKNILIKVKPGLEKYLKIMSMLIMWMVTKQRIPKKF